MKIDFPRALRSLALIGLVAWCGRAAVAGGVVNFDDLTLAPNSHWNGPDPNGSIVQGPYGPVVVGSFSSGDAAFGNRFDQTYGSWDGFAYSNETDTTTPGYMNQYSAFTGSGRGQGADNYGVAFGYADLGTDAQGNLLFDPADAAQLRSLPSIDLPSGGAIAGMYVTNTTYAALSMLSGDSFAKKFGGASGNDADWLKLTAYGINAAGIPLAASVEFYLADYRFADNRLDYIVGDWRFMDLGLLKDAASLYFNISGSDVGEFGLNTPAYFAVDDIQFASVASVPEPSTWMLGLTGIAIAGAARRRALNASR